MKLFCVLFKKYLKFKCVDLIYYFYIIMFPVFVGPFEKVGENFSFFAKLYIFDVQCKPLKIHERLKLISNIVFFHSIFILYFS